MTSLSRPRRSWYGFVPGVVALILLAALIVLALVGLSFHPLNGVPVFLALALPVVAVATWWWGAWAGVSAAVVATLVGVVPGRTGRSWSSVGPSDWAAPFVDHRWLGDLMLFWAASILIVWLIVTIKKVARRTPRERLRARLASRYDDHDDVVIATDFDANVLYMNLRAEQATGVSRSAAQGQPLVTVVTLHSSSGKRLDPFDSPFDSPFDGPPVDARRDPPDGALAGLPVLRLADQTDRPVLISTVPARGDNGRVEGTLLLLRDGTQTQETARHEAYLRDITMSSGDATIGVAQDGTIRSWSDGARALFSYQETDVLGEAVSILVNPERAVAIEQALRAVLAGERLLDRDLTVRSQDGREFDVSLAAFALKPVPGGDRGIVFIMRDIDERRLGERRIRHLSAQLVRRAQELQAIFDIAPVGLAIADSPDCRHVRPNLALCRALGLERTSEINLGDDAPYSIWCNGERMRADASPLHLAVARRAVFAPLELELRAQGREITVMAYSAPVIDQDNAVVGAIAVFVDISAMKHVHAERQRLLAEAIDARRTAEEASRLKEEFLATVSHELRTPLNAMHGWLEIMQRKPDQATQLRGLDVIRRNVRAQTRVIEDILDVSAFVTGKARLLVKTTDLLDVARATFESLHPTADAKSLQYHFEDEAGEVLVNGDPERLQQVIWNLLSNAVKFTPAGGRVDLRVKRDDGHAIVSVTDSGEGIDGHFLPYVFDRFRQADSSIERRHSGLGLGLAIVRHLTELHGGSVSVESDGLGKGARFSIRIPLRVAADSVTGASGRDADGDSAGAMRTGPGAVDGLAGKRVLIVEDDAFAADMLAQVLHEEGAQVSVAGSAEEGLVVLDEWNPEVIVSDIGMPGRDGYAFIADVRRVQRARGGMPVLALAVTAYARPEDRQHALSAGFDAYLVKPVAPSRIVRVLIDLLADPALHGFTGQSHDHLVDNTH
jgi:PAS domain S-box-containing protein